MRLRRATVAVLGTCLLATSALAAVRTIWVSTSGDDVAGAGTAGSPFRTITRAVAAASDGDTIRVLPGMYDECVDASSKSLTLVSDAIESTQPSNTTTYIDGTGTCGGQTCKSNRGLRCYSAQDCAGTCLNSVCSKTTTQHCLSELDCPTGEACTATSTTFTCSNDLAATCTIQTCVIASGATVGNCTGAHPVFCGTDGDCANLDCDFGACTRIEGHCGGPDGPWCTADADCDAGLTCVPLETAPVVALGEGSTLKGFTIRGGGRSAVTALGSTTVSSNRITASYSGAGGGGLSAGPGITSQEPRCWSDATLACGADADCRVCANDPAVKCLISQDCVEAGTGGTCVERGPCLAVTELTIENNLFQNDVADANDAGLGGGGVLARAATGPGTGTRFVVTANNFVSNTAAADGGGASLVAEGGGRFTVEVENDAFSKNAGLRGGGLSVLASSPGTGALATRVTTSVFTGNLSAQSGGGFVVDLDGSGSVEVDVTDNAVRSNTSGADGGGFLARASSDGSGPLAISATGNSVTDNTAKGGGGGIDARLEAGPSSSASPARLTLQGNEVVANSAGTGGGGVSALAASSSEGGIVADLTGNEVRGNHAASFGAGLALLATADGAGSSAASISRNVVVQNVASNATSTTDGDATGGGLFFFLGGSAGTASASVDFDTIASNSADAGAAGVEIESDTSGTGAARVDLLNSILSRNVGTAVGGPPPLAHGKVMLGTGRDLAVHAAYDVVFTGGWEDFERTIARETTVERDTIREADPLLDPEWSPRVCSPAVDAGDPAIDFSAEPLPNGGRINVGHLAATVAATPTVPDLNDDGEVDGMDLLRITASFGTSRTGSPDRFDAASDIDGDGTVDGNDLAFVAAFFGQSCPTTAGSTP